MRKVQHYGWKPDKPDHRDRIFRESTHFKVMQLPETVSLRDKLPACWNQGALGSCTGHGSVGALVFIHPDEMFSRLDAYLNGRALEGDIPDDNGAEIRDVISGLANPGVCLESVWPYDITTFATPPDLSTAVMTKIGSYYRIQDLDDYRNCLAQGFPVVFGFSVFENFENPDMEQTGILHLPGASDEMIGGHCVLGIGYDDNAQRIEVRNSWGPGWGPFQGNFFMNYDYFKQLVSDCWTIRQ